jgi:hypothetical protein
LPTTAGRERLVGPRRFDGDTVDADLTVSGTDARRSKSSVTLYAVDEGVLMPTGYQTPDPLPAFTTERNLAVFGLESRESLAHILSLKNGQARSSAPSTKLTAPATNTRTNHVSKPMRVGKLTPSPPKISPCSHHTRRSLSLSRLQPDPG